NIGPRASKRGGCLLMNDVLPNWTAAGRFKEACEAADAARDAGITHKEAVCEALRLTLCLVEDWRGDHRQEIADYLGTNAPKEGQDDVLAIVKHVFARQDKKQWNWHANALRQAIAENRTSDEVKAYFAQTPPTTAAQAWSKAHRRGRTGGATSEVAIPCVPSLAS